MQSSFHVSRNLVATRTAAVVCVLATLSSAVLHNMAIAADTSIPDQAELVKDNNAFAADLYAQLRSESGNLFFSPASISTGLAMTYAGARGQTATEMASVLHFTLPPERLNPVMGELLHARNVAHPGYNLKQVDTLWGQTGYAFLPDFLKQNALTYNAGFNQVDFKNATETSRQTINQWVEQQTENKIKDLIAPKVINSYTRLVLTDAIYFKCDWESLFEKKATQEEDFHISSAKTVKAPLMHRTDSFNYFDGGTFQALEIPYKNKELSMIAFLPKNVDGLPALEHSLTAENLHEWLSHLGGPTRTILSIPKFKLTGQFRIENTLMALGMKQAFDCTRADFSGMASKEAMHRDGNLCVAAVVHQAYVDVNEEGTEAAASTAVVLMAVPTAAPPPPPSPNIFRADHPFLFLIRDNQTGSILFMGRVINPNGIEPTADVAPATLRP